MTEFNDLNKALAALKSQMDKATTATEVVNRLGAAAAAMEKHATAVETRLGICEQGIAAIEKSINDFQQVVRDLAAHTNQQWQDATQQVLENSGQSYVATVSLGLQKAGTDFSDNVKALRKEWMQRELTLKRAKRWNWIIGTIAILLLLALATTTGLLPALFRALMHALDAH